MKKHILLSTLILTLTLLTVGCTKNQTNTNTNQSTVNKNTNQENTNTNSSTDASDQTDTSGWVSYENEEYGYGFKYLSDLYKNYTSQEKLPFYRTKIADVPRERTDENPFADTYDEVIKEKEEINNVNIDEVNYVYLVGDIKSKITIGIAEGGGIVKSYIWYDEIYKYELKFVFPNSEEVSQGFNELYDTSEKRKNFIEDIKNGEATQQYQELFDQFDEVAVSLYKL